MPDPRDNQPLGQSIGEIVDRTTALIHDEIELARAEITIALKNLLRGSVATILGGIFAFFGLIILLMGISLFLTDLIADQYPWIGFFIVALFLFLIGAIAAVFALRKIQRGAKLVPQMAIDEARKTQEALRSEDEAPAVQQFEGVVVEEAPVEASAVEEAAPADGRDREAPGPSSAPEADGADVDEREVR